MDSQELLLESPSSGSSQNRNKKQQQQQQQQQQHDTHSKSNKHKQQQQQQQQHYYHNRSPLSSPRGGGGGGTPDMTLLLHRVDLFDTGHSDDDRIHHPSLVLQQQQTVYQTQIHPNSLHVQPAYFALPTPLSLQDSKSINCNNRSKSINCNNDKNNKKQQRQQQQFHLAACRVPPQTHPSPVAHRHFPFPVVDNTTPNPHKSLLTIDKYWQQRRRLFSLFDQGIELDEEGWFSVTPEQIADHVALRVSELIVASTQGLPPARPLVLLDAFCGCGGNAIAFARQPHIVVYAVDTDRSKLQKAAHNAQIYQIPPSKLIFVECNVLFLLEYCFQDGQFVLDQPIDTPEKAAQLLQHMPPPVSCETTKGGFTIGGIDLLPRNIDAVFMDPPWGGQDYEVFGKHGYDLEKNMKIKRPAIRNDRIGPAATAATANLGALQHDFFDTFTAQPLSKKERMDQFNLGLDQHNCVHGAQLLALAAAATATRWVIFDIPRNTNHKSIGQAALAAGYRGNIKVEEHYLNGRLKTVTAYLGSDWRGLVQAGIVHVSSWTV